MNTTVYKDTLRYFIILGQIDLSTRNKLVNKTNHTLVRRVFLANTLTHEWQLHNCSMIWQKISTNIKQFIVFTHYLCWILENSHSLRFIQYTLCTGRRRRRSSSIGRPTKIQQSQQSQRQHWHKRDSKSLIYDVYYNATECCCCYYSIHLLPEGHIFQFVYSMVVSIPSISKQ